MIGKITLIVKKVTKTVADPKNAKIFTLKLNLNIQNIYMEPKLKLKNANNKHIEMAYVTENVSYCFSKK
jgi:hypothetical protein